MTRKELLALIREMEDLAEDCVTASAQAQCKETSDYYQGKYFGYIAAINMLREKVHNIIPVI